MEYYNKFIQLHICSKKREQNNIIYNQHFCIELKTLILLGVI